MVRTFYDDQTGRAAGNDFAPNEPIAPGKRSRTHRLPPSRAVQRAATGDVPVEDVHTAAAAGVATPTSPLPFREELGRAFGGVLDVGQVRAHSGGLAEDSARAMGATAYASGHDVVLPANPSLHLVAHEVAHVAQQRGGVHLAGGVGAAGDAYEREADEIADAVVRGDSVAGRFATAGSPSVAVQRQQAPGGQAPDMWQHIIGERSTAVGKLARVRAPKGVRLRTKPAVGAPDVGIMPFDELVQVERKTEHGWCWVASMGAMGGRTGYCEEQFLSIDPPEPTAHLHRVEPGERLADIAVRHYGADMTDANNARLYVQALYLANEKHAGVYLDKVELGFWDAALRSGREEETVEVYKGAKVRAGLAIWVPSQAFIAQLRAQGAVSSGSTAPMKAWRQVKGVIDDAIEAAKYAAGFVVGLMEGAWGAIVDLFAGAAEMIEAVAKVVYHLITGNPLAIKDMLMEWVDKLAVAWASRDKIADEFMRKWEAKDGWDRGTFQGEVLGWVMMTALIAILTAGEGAAVMMTGKWASILKTLKTLDALGDVTTYARKAGKLPAKAVELVQGKLGKSARKAEKTAGDAANAAEDAAEDAARHAATGDAADARSPEGPQTDAVARLSSRLAHDVPVEIGDATHHLKVWETPDGRFTVSLCSDCAAVRTSLDDVLAQAPAHGPGKSLKRRLTLLLARVEALEAGLANGSIKHTAAVNELNQIGAHLRDAYKKFPSADGLCVFCNFKARLDHDALAKSLGFERTANVSHGQPVYRRGKIYISRDIDGHNGGVWKKATGSPDNLRNKTTRDGTFNEDLTEQVGP